MRNFENDFIAIFLAFENYQITSFSNSQIKKI